MLITVLFERRPRVLSLREAMSAGSISGADQEGWNRRKVVMASPLRVVVGDDLPWNMSLAGIAAIAMVVSMTLPETFAVASEPAAPARGRFRACYLSQFDRSIVDRRNTS